MHSPSLFGGSRIKICWWSHLVRLGRILNNLRRSIQTNFSATFKPSISVSGSQVELNINGVLGATVHGRGFTPNTELKGSIYMKPNISLVPNYYLIATVGESIVFLFRARDPSGPIIGGATFTNPFKADIDWHGNLDWKNLVPPPSGVNGTELVGPGIPPA